MEDLAKLFGTLENCAKGKHQLDVISESAELFGASEVVRWCRTCGSVVIDVDYDGRTQPGRGMKMKSPEVSKFIVYKKKEVSQVENIGTEKH